MKTSRIARYQMSNLLRSRWLIGYTMLLGIVAYGLFAMGGDTPRVVLSLTNLVLAVVPLVSILFGALYLYNSEEFIELLLSQPLSRRQVYKGLYFGISLPLSLCALIGLGIPLILYGTSDPASLRAIALLLLLGTLLSFTFSSFAFGIALYCEDKAKGLGSALLVWLFFTVIYDGVILLLVMKLREYPLELPLLVTSLLNPIDLGRIAMLIELDVSALMGYTGAVFQSTLSSVWSGSVPLVIIFLWNVVGYFVAKRVFCRKDF